MLDDGVLENIVEYASQAAQRSMVTMGSKRGSHRQSGMSSGGTHGQVEAWSHGHSV